MREVQRAGIAAVSDLKFLAYYGHCKFHETGRLADTAGRPVCFLKLSARRGPLPFSRRFGGGAFCLVELQYDFPPFHPPSVLPLARLEPGVLRLFDTDYGSAPSAVEAPPLQSPRGQASPLPTDFPFLVTAHLPFYSLDRAARKGAGIFPLALPPRLLHRIRSVPPARVLRALAGHGQPLWVAVQFSVF